MAERYLRASGNWNGPVWAATSSGAPGSASTPTVNDEVRMWSGGLTVTLTSNATCGNIWMTSGRLNLNGFKLSTFTNAQTLSGGVLDLTDGTLELSYKPGTSSGFSIPSGVTVISANSLIDVISTHPSGSGYVSLGAHIINAIAINMTGNGENLRIIGSPTLGSLTIQSNNNAVHTVTFDGGATVQAGHFSISGRSGFPISLRSTLSGTRYSLVQPSGAVNANYLDLRDSQVGGGATWNALYSTDSGNNEGWDVIGVPRISPTSIPSAEAFDQPSFSPGITYVDLDSALSAEAHGEPRLNMQIRPSSVSSAEAFGMLTTKLVFGLEGIPSAESVSPVSFTTQFITAAGDIPSEEGFGTPLNTMFMSAFGNIAPEAAVEAPSFIQSAPPPPPPTDWSAVGKQDEKYYLYKISKSDGTYVGVWVDPADNLEFTERINSPGTTTTVRLARSANTTREVRANLLTQGGDFLTTEDGARLVSVYETPNTVGEGTDVELNYNVDIYVHYGEFARLVTQLGEPIVTQAGDNIMVVSGAPLGTRVFSGYVLDYDASYGEESSVWVTVVSHGNELSDQEVLDGDMTNVRFSGTELSAITKSVLDTNPGRMSYSSVSLPSTGVTQTMDFQLNTKLEAIQSIYDQTPDGWYWYGDVAENLIYMRPVSQGYDHTFVVGWHIKTVRIKRTMEGLKNRVYFVGGQTDPNNPATTKFKKYENPTSQSQWRVGLERITDRRYTLDASMLARGNKVLSAGAAPVYTTTVTITSGRYDIESIKIGQTVGFKNFGNYIDGVPPLQIVSKTYTPTAVTLELGALLDRQVDTLSKTEKALNNEQYQNLPNTPS